MAWGADGDEIPIGVRTTEGDGDEMVNLQVSIVAAHLAPIGLGADAGGEIPPTLAVGEHPAYPLDAVAPAPMVVFAAVRAERCCVLLVFRVRRHTAESLTTLNALMFDTGDALPVLPIVVDVDASFPLKLLATSGTLVRVVRPWASLPLVVAFPSAEWAPWFL